MKKKPLIPVLLASIALLVIGDIAQTERKPRLLRSGVALTEEKLVTVDKITCGLIEGRWLAGKLSKNHLFFSHREQAALYNRKAAALKKNSQRTAPQQTLLTRYLRQAKNFGKLEKSQSPTCLSLGSPQTPTPTTATTLPTSTPIPPTATPVPLLATPTFTLTPISGGGSLELTNYSLLEGLSIYAADGTYLGRISSNQFSTDSIANQFSTYGSTFSVLSIYNEFGIYGSKFQSYSAFNSFSFRPPIIEFGTTLVAYLTTNKFIGGIYVDSCKLSWYLNRGSAVTSRCY